MKSLTATMFAALLPLAFCLPATAHESPDPSIKHNARDGKVKLYGAGGPDTAFKKVAEVFHKETGIDVEITTGPEATGAKKAQGDGHILVGLGERETPAFL